MQEITSHEPLKPVGIDSEENAAPLEVCDQLWYDTFFIILYKTITMKALLKGNPKGDQPWVFTGRTDADTEAPILWSSDAKSQLIEKDPDAG